MGSGHRTAIWSATATNARVDRRTLEAQGIDREPTTHLGPQATAIERRKAMETERGQA